MKNYDAAYDAIDIARYSINYLYSKGIYITHLQLQHLLYRIQLTYLLNTKQFLFKDTLKMSNYGTYIQTIKNEFAINGMCSLPYIDIVIDKNNWSHQINFDKTFKFKKDIDKKIVEFVLNKHGYEPIHKLVNWSIRTEPFIKAYNYGCSFLPPSWMIETVEKQHKKVIN